LSTQTRNDRSPSPARSSSPYRRTPTSVDTSEKLTNGQNVGHQPTGIAAALQNLLQTGQNTSMQQVYIYFVKHLFFVKMLKKVTFSEII